MRKKKQEEVTGPDQGWLVTYGDLMSLLLTFFVLLLTFSSIQLNKFKKAMGSLRGALGVLEVDRGEKILVNEFMAYDAMINIKEEIEEFVDQNHINDLLDIEMTANKGLKISLNNAILFQPGKATLKASVSPILEKIGALAKKHKKVKIIVEGHTDNVPIHTPEYESNWELSAARALSVVKFLINNLSISPTRLIAVGRGEYKPLVPNKTPENRARNRRVEIYLKYETE